MSIKLFGRWDTSGVKVEDPGLKPYINLRPIIMPKTGGRNTGVMFHKSKTNIVERLVSKIMVPGHKGKKHKLSSGHCCGKSSNKLKIVEEMLKLVEARTKKNPVEVLVKAIENAAPREEITTIEYGGARYPKAAECSPQRRVDFALRMFVQGAYSKSFNSRKKLFETLADEILKAYNMDQSSAAIAKKLELERQADASR